MSTEQNPILRRFVRMALFGGGAFAAGTLGHSSIAEAQATAAAAATPADTSASLQEVVVTGSRIAAPNLESISPVTAVTSEEIKTTGVVRIEDLLNSLPQVVADQSSGLSMGSNGTATLNLRGLGAQRTLVLVNGRRLQGGDPGAALGATPAFASAADINQIPVSLIDRVDVLTGGASSTYGADAVAGVVNFIMNDHFEGVRLDSNFGVYNHSNHEGWINPLLTAKHFGPVTGTNWDGNNKDFTVVLGQAFADGAGHMEGYLGYRRTAPITADHRDHAACVLTSAGSSTSAGPYVCSGSSNSAPAVFYSSATGHSFQFDPTGQVVPKYQRYNYAATHYLERNDERYTAGFMGKLKLNDHAEAYSDFSFMDDITTGAYAPAGAFLGSGKNTDSDTGLPDGNMSVNCGSGAFGNSGMNPYLTASEFTSICAGGVAGGPVLSYTNATRATVGLTNPAVLTAAPYQIQNGLAQLIFARRNIEGGPRQDNYTHTAYRGVLGLRGEITEGWTYDAYGLFSQTRSLDFHNNDTSTALIQNALLAVKNPAGQVVCQGNQPGCVPWNIWNPATPPSAAALKYISAPGEYSANSQEDVASAYVSGDLTNRGVKTPWAADGLKVVFGTEYRRDTLTTQPDQELLTADLAGFGSPIVPVNALAHVWEGFTEARMPIAHDMPGMKSLDVEAGYRYSSYSEGFNTNTYKIGLEWAPVSDVRLRASYNQAVRVPNLQELFQPQHVGLDGGSDICAAGTKLTALQCSYLGVTAAQYATGVPPSPASQYNGLIGGATNLRPETAKTKNIGVVFTPSFLPGFTSTLDYTDIKITNLIQSFGATTIQANCLATADAASVWCQKIHRSPLGDLWTSSQGYIVDPLLNEGGLENEGIDLGMAYRLDMGSWGKFRSRLDAGYLLKLLYTPASVGGIPGKPYECAGQFGFTCSANTPPAPKYRHRLALDWDTPLTGFSAGATWRFFGIVHNDITNPSSPDYRAAFGVPVDNTIPTISYLDLRVSYNINKITVRVGANNVLDKDPPIIDTLNDTGNSIYGESNTFPSLYDSLGRYIYANVTIDF
jgi:iron complex outermembrane receptor protein